MAKNEGKNNKPVETGAAEQVQVSTDAAAQVSTAVGMTATGSSAVESQGAEALVRALENKLRERTEEFEAFARRVYDLFPGAHSLDDLQLCVKAERELIAEQDSKLTEVTGRLARADEYAEKLEALRQGEEEFFKKVSARLPHVAPSLEAVLQLIEHQIGQLDAATHEIDRLANGELGAGPLLKEAHVYFPPHRDAIILDNGLRVMVEDVVGYQAHHEYGLHIHLAGLPEPMLVEIPEHGPQVKNGNARDDKERKKLRDERIQLLDRILRAQPLDHLAGLPEPMLTEIPEHDPRIKGDKAKP